MRAFELLEMTKEHGASFRARTASLEKPIIPISQPPQFVWSPVG